MATIPQYKPQVRDEALRPVFQNTPDVSSGAQAVARGLQSVGNTLDNIAQRDATAQANEVEAEITANWLKWDAENRQKYVGQNADGYAPAAETWWKESAAAAANRLNPLAKRLAGQSLMAKQNAAMGGVLRFQSAEKERHADEAYSADITSTIQFGVDTGSYDATAQQVREKAAQLGARKGWTTEQVQAEQLKNVGALHGVAIARLVDANPAMAEAYYNGAKDRGEIPAAAQPRIEKMLGDAVGDQFATQKAAELAALPLDQQLAEAAKIKDPQRREKTLAQIKNNHALVKQAERDREDSAADQAWQLFAQGRAIPQTTLAAMAGRDRVQLQETMRARSERIAAGRAVKTDIGTYIDVREKLARGEKVDLRGYTEKIGPGDMEKLLDIQTAVAKPGTQDSVLTDEARINGALLRAGIDGKKDPETAFTVKTAIDARVRAESAARGNKPLNADEKQKIVDAVLTDTVMLDRAGPDWAWPNSSRTRPASALTPEQQRDAYVTIDGEDIYLKNIPAMDRALIADALRAEGLPVTEQAIARFYVRAKKASKK